MPNPPPDTTDAADEVVRLRERVTELELQLARSAARSDTERDEQRHARESLAFLAEASAILASSLDYEETLAHLARLSVPHIADWCAIDLRTKEGGIERLAVAHVDPAKVSLAQEIHTRWPPNPEAPTGVPNVIRTGKPEVHPDITEDLVRAVVADAELLAIMLRLGLRSSMVVPLVARGRTLGAITLVSAESNRRFDQTDLRVAEDLASRAAIAIDNAELYRELRQFRTTLDRTHDCVFMFDAATLCFFYVNQGAIDQVGYSEAELTAMTPLAIKPEFDEASFRALVAPLVAGEQNLVTFETVHRHKDGHTIPVEISLQYVDPPEGDPRFVAVVRDITERKRVDTALRASEERYRALADSMPMVVWTATPAGDVSYFNRRWFDYSGLSAEETYGSAWDAVIHPDDRARTLERWAHSVRTGADYEIEYRWRRGADGAYRWWLGRGVPVRDESGAITHWVGTGTDIDDQKRTEVSLREYSSSLTRTTRQLEERNRELDQFAYITSHDLKAPLRGIANLSQWIEEDLGDHATEEIRQQLELLRGRAHRMEALIDGILQYSRVGRVGEAPQQVDMGQLLDEVVDLLAPPPGTVTVEPGMPTIVAERVPLQQVFHNLIGNALKHGGPGVRVSVSCRERDEGYAFTVADNGPGIAPQYHDRIFGIFQTLASRDRVEGSGLGLALVKKIVEHRGGEIALESAEGRGAAFTFTWPHNAAENRDRR